MPADFPAVSEEGAMHGDTFYRQVMHTTWQRCTDPLGAKLMTTRVGVRMVNPNKHILLGPYKSHDMLMIWSPIQVRDGREVALTWNEHKGYYVLDGTIVMRNTVADSDRACAVVLQKWKARCPIESSQFPSMWLVSTVGRHARKPQPKVLLDAAGQPIIKRPRGRPRTRW